MAKISVNREVCGGHGECEALAPLVFEVQDDGIVKAKVAEVPPGELEGVRSATICCPTGALTLSE
jgi:ferredoxin